MKHSHSQRSLKSTIPCCPISSLLTENFNWYNKSSPDKTLRCNYANLLQRSAAICFIQTFACFFHRRISSRKARENRRLSCFYKKRIRVEASLWKMFHTTMTNNIFSGRSLLNFSQPRINILDRLCLVNWALFCQFLQSMSKKSTPTFIIQSHGSL